VFVGSQLGRRRSAAEKTSQRYRGLYREVGA
jgi:hypothetical protein